MTTPATSCEIGADERISLQDPRLRDCLLAPGTRITIQYNPPREASHMGKRKHAPAPADEADDVQPAEPAQEAPLAAPALPVPVGPAAPAGVPVVGVPRTAADELAGLVPAGGELNGLSLVLALIAVMGGGAAWKFYSQRSKQQHEQAMRALDIQAAQVQPADCKTAHVATQEELRQLAQRVGRIDQVLTEVADRPSGVTLPDGLADLEERIEKLERAGKPARRGKGTT